MSRATTGTPRGPGAAATEAPAAEALLAEAKRRARRFELLHSLAAEGYVVLDRDGTVRERHSLRSRGSAPARPPFERVAEGSVAAWRSALSRAAASPGTAVELPDAEIVDAEGDCHRVEIVLADLRDEPSVGGLVATYWDISPRVQAQAPATFQARLLAAVAQAVVAVDREGRILYWSPAAERLYGWAEHEALGRSHQELFGSMDLPELAPARAAFAGGWEWTGETSVARRDGRRIPVSVSLTPLVDGDGGLTAAVVVSADLSERRQAEDRRAAAEARFAAAFHQSGYGMALTDLGLGVTVANPALCGLLGRSEEELLGRQWTRFLHPDDRRAGRDLRPVEGGRVSVERRFVRPDGGIVSLQVDLNLVRDPEGRPCSYMVQLQDVTARRRAEAELEHRALHDDLTGLPNRTLVVRHLDLALADHGDAEVGVIFVDVDGFGHINDVLGHDAGDRVLVELAERLRRVVRADDTVGRCGGDEFVLVCRDVGSEELAALAERVAQAAEAPVGLRGRQVPLRVGLGITMSRPGSTSRSLLSEADAAVARAKEIGRGRAAVFDESLRSKARALLEGERKLRTALDRGEIVAHFQPIVDLPTGRLVGFEALARWQRNNHPVPAQEWIDVAQRSGLIVELSEVVLAGAVAEAAEWNRRQPERRLWVAANLDASHLVENRLPEVVDRMLSAAGLDPQLLHLEITETAVMRDLEASAAVLGALRDLDVHLSVDDFGTGYSSLAYLRRLPVDTIKIDRSFVAELDGSGGGGDGDATIVRAVLGLGKALGLRCVAEGVETAEQRHVLAGLGCELGQGYLWSRALAPDDARRWVDQPSPPCPPPVGARRQGGGNRAARRR